MLGGAKRCAKCEKLVYPIEELKCLDKVNTKISVFKLSNSKIFDVLFFLSQVMAQKLLQMHCLQFTPEYEKLQGLRKATVLRRVR
jgi:hypothetical protein